jgi:Ras-related GTP-binding protein A/B
MLICIFDNKSDQPNKDFDHFAGVLEGIEENSPDACIFVLVHKINLVAPGDQHIILEDRERFIEFSCCSSNDVHLGQKPVQGLVWNCHQFDS